MSVSGSSERKVGESSRQRGGQLVDIRSMKQVASCLTFGRATYSLHSDQHCFIERK